MTEGIEEMSIGPARTADLPAMAALLAELFSLESDFQPDTARQLAGLALILEESRFGQLFVLRDGERVLGMANALITVSTALGARVVVLEDVIVTASHRGRGLGRRLVEAVFAWASSEGFARLTLLADRDNASALAFYDALGFTRSAMVVRRKALAR